MKSSVGPLYLRAHCQSVICIPQIPSLCVYLIIDTFYLGIGRGIAIKLAELGAKVVAVARTQEDLDSLQKKVR